MPSFQLFLTCHQTVKFQPITKKNRQLCPSSLKLSQHPLQDKQLAILPTWLLFLFLFQFNVFQQNMVLIHLYYWISQVSVTSRYSIIPNNNPNSGHFTSYCHPFWERVTSEFLHWERTSMILHSRMTMENLLENLQGDSPRWPWRICYVVPWRISKVLEILQGWPRSIYEPWHFISNLIKKTYI